MIHPDIHAMLVRERSATLLAAAAAYRRGRQARSAAATASRAAAKRTAPDKTAPDRTAPDRTAPDKTAERGRVVLRFFTDAGHRGSGIAEYETGLDGTSSQAS